MKLYLQRWRDRLADPRLHEVLWRCLPAVLIGLALRVWLTWALPYGHFHPDTHDFLATPKELIGRGHLTIHSKTTFLTPVLYCVPFLLKMTALLAIPLGQHARGLLLVLFAGALARLWFVRWRWWIVPVTTLVAVQPAMLFWEHTLLSESGFVFHAVALALAGTLFVRRPDWEAAGFLLLAMFTVAGARPEGAILAGAGVAVVGLVSWGQWHAFRGKLAAAAAVCLGMVAAMQTSHSGLLLYASLLHLSPAEPRSVPGFGPYIKAIREDRIRSRAESVSHDVVRAGKNISGALRAYARDHPTADLHLDDKKRRRNPAETSPLVRELTSDTNVSAVCRGLAREAALAHLAALPGVAVGKFLAMIQGDSGGRINELAFYQKQVKSLIGAEGTTAVLGLGLAGVPLNTAEQIQAFVGTRYLTGRAAWFNSLASGWLHAVNAVHLPSIPYSATYRLPGLPAPFFVAILGALTSLFYPSRWRRFQWAFLSAFFAMWFIVGLAAEVIPRHRFVLEPFWILYFFAACDAATALGSRIFSRMRNS